MLSSTIIKTAVVVSAEDATRAAISSHLRDCRYRVRCYDAVADAYEDLCANDDVCLIATTAEVSDVLLGGLVLCCIGHEQNTFGGRTIKSLLVGEYDEALVAQAYAEMVNAVPWIGCPTIEDEGLKKIVRSLLAVAVGARVSLRPSFAEVQRAVTSLG